MSRVFGCVCGEGIKKRYLKAQDVFLIAVFTLCAQNSHEAYHQGVHMISGAQYSSYLNS